MAEGTLLIRAYMGDEKAFTTLIEKYKKYFGKNLPQDSDIYKVTNDNSNLANQSILGTCFIYGIGGKRDWNKAFECMLKAVASGKASVQSNLGFLYAGGRGVKQNHHKAVELFTKAANQGFVNAIYNLVYHYANGVGVEKNLSKAISLLQQAADAGIIPAMQQLASIEEKFWKIA